MSDMSDDYERSECIERMQDCLDDLRESVAAAIVKLRGRITMYENTHAVHRTDVTKARVDTASIILDDLLKEVGDG